jgi:lipopolysaccharide export LptBFGC system permease protein LptF
MQNKTTHTSTFFKLVAISALCTGLLSGCFNFSGSSGSTSTGNQTSVDEQHKLYETNAFSVVVPKTWDVFEKDDFTSDVPEETIVVFRNNVKNENFTANVNIVQNNLQQPLSLLDYAKMVNNRQRSGLYDYKETKKEDFKLKIGSKEEPSYIIMFEAKKTPDEKVVRYIQGYGISGNSAYIITGAISTQENDNVVKTIEDIVKSFKLK